MADGINKRASVVGFATESTEGTYVAPTDFVQPLDGFEITPARETLARDILTNELTSATPRVGLKSSAMTMPLELKANGLEGDAPESDLLLRSLLGQRNQQTTQTTSGTGHTSTQINLSGATIGNFVVGATIVILESGSHHPAIVTVVDTSGGSENITISPAAPFTPSDAVLISKYTQYEGVNTGHLSLSGTIFWGDEIDERATGLRTTELAIENFTTGQLPQFSFTLAGMDFTRQDGSSSAPTYTTGLPPVVLNACLNQDGNQLSLNDFSLTVTNEVIQKKDFCTASGITGQVYVKRTVTGSMNPYMDDTTTTQFDKFDANSEFSLTLTAFTPSTTAGEILLGSVFGLFLPQCVNTASPIGDLDGILTDNVEFSATGGADGTSRDIYIGFV